MIDLAVSDNLKVAFMLSNHPTLVVFSSSQFSRKLTEKKRI